MNNYRIPKQGEIYHHFKDRLYQIITVATHTETDEKMVVYQALYGEYKSYVRPLAMFLSEVDKDKYPQVNQKYRFELVRTQEGEPVANTDQENYEKENHNEVLLGTDNVNTLTDAKGVQDQIESNDNNKDQIESNDNNKKQKEEELFISEASQKVVGNITEDSVNSILLNFLDANSYNKKLEVITSNAKHLTDRLVNDMAVSLDCTVEEGPLEQRIQGLIHCLQAMRRFEDRRLR